MAEIRIFRIKDGDVLAALDQICRVTQTNAQLQLGMGERVRPITVVMPDEVGSNPEVQAILSADAALIEFFIMTLSNGVTVHVNRKPEGFDTYNLIFPQNYDPGSAATLLGTCAHHFRPVDRSDATARLLGEELAEFYRRREQSVLKLEDLVQTQIERNSEYRRQVDTETTELRGRLQKDAEDTSTQFRAEFDAKDAALKTKEAEFEERVKALDDRRATHARRQIHAGMKERIADREREFSLTEKTVAKRRPIHVLFWLLISTSALLLLWGLWDVVAHGVQWGGNPYDWSRLLRIPLAAAATAGFIVYYIRWNDQWFRQHSEEEFRLKRLALDIDRAAWMVEMMLEWKEEKDSAIPPELIDRLSRNLFVTEGTDAAAVRHPAQDLASLLLQASWVTIPLPTGGSATFDAKHLRRLQSAEGVKERTD